MCTALVEGVLSVLEKLLVPGVVFVDELFAKDSWAVIGVDLLDFPLGIFLDRVD